MEVKPNIAEASPEEMISFVNSNKNRNKRAMVNAPKNEEVKETLKAGVPNGRWLKTLPASTYKG